MRENKLIQEAKYEVICDGCDAIEIINVPHAIPGGWSIVGLVRDHGGFEGRTNRFKLCSRCDGQLFISNKKMVFNFLKKILGAA